MVERGVVTLEVVRMEAKWKKVLKPISFPSGVFYRAKAPKKTLLGLRSRWEMPSV